MITFSSLQETYGGNGPLAMALGYFDGVHLGHRAVTQNAVKQAKRGFTPAVFTFDLNRDAAKRAGGFLYPAQQRLEKLAGLGAQVVLCPPFESFAQMSPREFVDCLVSNFNVGHISCGDDFTFGKNKSGNVAVLRELAGRYGVTVEVVPPVTLGGKRVSTTQIKAYLSQGWVEPANEMLGSPYSMRGLVVKGKQLGRTVDRPTINQHYEEGQFIPKFGAYASVALVDGKPYFSSSNIGIRPTVGGEFPLCETYLLDFDRELYGQVVEVYFFQFMRAEKKFHSLAEIKDNVLDIALHSKNSNFTIY